MNFKRLVLGCIEASNFASKYSSESSWRDLQDLHAFAPLRPQYFSKFSSKFFGVFKIRHAEKFDFFQISSWFSLIFMKFCRIFSDFFEKRCNYSKYLDFNSILAWLYRIIIFFRDDASKKSENGKSLENLIFDLIFDLIWFNFIQFYLILHLIFT